MINHLAIGVPPFYQWPSQEPKLEVPTIYKAYVREYTHKIWPYMVQYLHFRILKFPLILSRKAMETPYITNPPATPKDMDTAVALVESLALATSDPLPSTVSVSSLLGDSQRAEAKEVPGWNGLRFRLDMVIMVDNMDEI